MSDETSVGRIIRFTLPIEPRAKQRPRINKYGGVMTPIETRRFEATVKLLSKRYAPMTPHDGPVKLEIKCIFKLPLRGRSPNSAHTSRPDGDNLLKALCDAFNGLFYSDDCQCFDKRISKYYAFTGEKSRIDVMIELL